MKAFQVGAYGIDKLAFDDIGDTLAKTALSNHQSSDAIGTYHTFPPPTAVRLFTSSQAPTSYTLIP